MLRWCDRRSVTYIVGITGNSRLNALSEEAQKLAEENYVTTKEKQRMFDEFKYAARSWKYEGCG